MIFNSILLFTCNRAWSISYVDNGLIQFAGGIGLVSLGLEKNFSRYSIGGMYGVVPSEVSGGPVIESVTLRQTFRIAEWKRFDFYTGLNISHVLGLDYHTQEYKDSPSGYYSIGNIRGVLNLGLSLAITKNETRFFYFETGINDIWIANYYANRDEVNPSDHVQLGMGFKYRF